MFSVTDINIKNAELTTRFDKSTLDAITGDSSDHLIQLETIRQLIEEEGDENNQQAKVIESNAQSIKALRKKVDTLNSELSEIQKTHNDRVE